MVTTLMTRPIFTIVRVFMATPIILTGSNIAPEASAQSIYSSLLTEQVKITREISALIEQIWNIASNID
jgi:hypothetical protein